MKLQRKSTTHTVLKTLHFTPELKKMLGKTGMRKIGPACLPMKLIEHCVPCGFSLAVCRGHRNLSTRTKKTLVKSLLISTLDEVVYYKGTFLQGSTKPLFTTQNRLETS
jgi:hypothetical protein